MNILHVLSQHEVTGAETYAAALIARQADEGHRVLVVSDTLATPVAAEYVPMPIGRRGYAWRVRNVLALRRLIRHRGVHLVHAHSRAGSWVAYFATRFTRVPLVSSLHIMQSPHLSLRLFSVYGEQAVSVTENVRSDAMATLGLRPQQVHLIPNGVDCDHLSRAPARSAARAQLGVPLDVPVVVLLGRLSGKRTVVAEDTVSQTFPRIRAAVPGARLIVVGGMRMPESFPGLVAATNRRLGADAVLHAGHQSDVRPYLAAADVVIAAGRSAIEALVVGRPVVALGESCYIGVVSEATADAVQRTNFGDFARGARPDPTAAAAAVVSLLRDPERRRELAAWGNAFARRTYDVRTVWRRLETVYRGARALRTRPARIRVVRCDPWVAGAGLGARLDALLVRNYTPVTFGAYAAALAGERVLPARPVILTFHGARPAGVRRALPALTARALAAVVFLGADGWAGVAHASDGAAVSERPLDRDEIAAMVAQGTEFGTDAPAAAWPVPDGAERLASVLARARQGLEEHTGSRILSFCYQRGRADATLKEAAARAGYAFGVASGGTAPPARGDLLEIRRSDGLIRWPDLATAV